MNQTLLLRETADRFGLLVFEPFAAQRLKASAEKVEDCRDRGHLMVFRKTPENIDLLGNYGFNLTALSPFRRDYRPPLLEGQFRPMPHQVETAAFLTQHPRCYVTSEMRTAKTGAVVMALDYLNQTGESGKTLIVCPASIMHGVWARSVERTLHVSVGLLRGTPAARRKVLSQPYGYYVINYEGLDVIADDLEDLLEKGTIDKVVVDELNHYGNPSSKRFKVADRLFNSHGTRVKWLWGLTGTPGADPVAVYGYCRLINFDNMPWKTKGSWQDAVQYKYGREAWMWRDRDCAPDLINQVMRPNIRFTVKEVLPNLPPVVYERWEAPMSKEQRAAYDGLKSVMIAQLATGEFIEATQKAALLSKLFQISTGTAITDRGPRDIPCPERLKVLAEAVKETSAKSVVFVSFVSAAHKVTDYLNGIGIHAAKVTGQVTGATRDAIFRDFQETDKYRVLVAHPTTTAYGTELAAADQLILYGPTMQGCHTYMQGTHRLSSVKQTSDLIKIIELSSSPEEDIFFDALRERESRAKAIGLVFESLGGSRHGSQG
jgi:SNF2 family DNA or RNA helicase